MGPLGHLHDAMSAHVNLREIPGATWIVSHGDEVHSGVVGSVDFDDAPLSLDAIFRVASVTKPMITAVAMMLVEDGTLFRGGKHSGKSSRCIAALKAIQRQRKNALCRRERGACHQTVQ
jgi:hypothetical protein